MQYGLIGAQLGHSFSKLIHESLCDYTYELCPLPTQQHLDAFLRARAFRAVNVTIPYKQAVLAHCETIDARAAAIGCVNTLINRDGKLHGYNTDAAGFAFLAAQAGVCFAGKHVLVLGTGGTQKTVCAVAQEAGAASITLVSRAGVDATKSTAAHARPTVTYAQACTLARTNIIVNTTPCGMYPATDAQPLALDAFPALTGVLDAIYNPLRTQLVQDARARGIAAAGGLVMLAAQAKYAAELFTDTQIPDREITRVWRELLCTRTNVVLIGMPGSGKTRVGKQLATLLRRPFVDLDEQIVTQAGRPIADIFAAEGEQVFRDLESAACANAARETGQVIATGGGAILRPENVQALRQNGVLLYLNRPLMALQTGGGRPLSANAAAVNALYEARAPLYLAAADKMICNHTTLEQAALAAKEALYEIVATERS